MPWSNTLNSAIRFLLICIQIFKNIWLFFTMIQTAWILSVFLIQSGHYPKMMTNLNQLFANTLEDLPFGKMVHTTDVLASTTEWMRLFSELLGGRLNIS